MPGRVWIVGVGETAGLYGSWLPRRSRAVNQILYFPRKEVARCNLRAGRRAVRERAEEEAMGAVAG